MSSNPRNQPTLPQNDPAREQQQRRDQLAAAAGSYQWSDAVATLPGVPLAAAVPGAENPSVRWLINVAKVAADVALNQLLVKLGNLIGGFSIGAAHAEGGTRLLAHVEAVRASVKLIEAEHQAAQPADPAAADFGAAQIRAQDDQHRIQLWAHIESLKHIVEDNYLDSNTGAALADYRKLFKVLPLPEIADRFMQNDSFARMRVAGPNSALLRGIDALPINLPLSDNDYVRMLPGDSLQTALAQGRIYLLDYAELEVLQAGMTGTRQKYVFAPMALFALPSGGSSLVPVAIQTGQDPGSHPIFLRADSNADPHWWSWQMAMTVVQVADGNYHELFAHLARTHLVVEAFALATHRQLAPEHPLNALLLPHFEGTLFINSLAAGSLIAKGGPIDQIFGGTIESTQLAAVQDRLAFDFSAHPLPVDLQTRKVADTTKLPDYPYRDDGLLVWNCIAQWVRDYVAVYYGSDADVTADYELANWLQEIAGSGCVKGLPSVDGRAPLCTLLTTLIFTASAQHAAVNFPQRTLMSYAPAITGAAWAPGPNAQTAATEDTWLALLPPIDQAQQQLNTLWLLGSIHYNTLGEYTDGLLGNTPWFRDARITADGGPLQQFQAALKVADAEIDKRNLSRAVPYVYLKPGLVPGSVNI